MSDMTEIEQLILTEVRRRAASWAEVRERAERGLEFATARIAAFGPDVDRTLGALKYWHGKADAYTAILELL